MPNSALISAEEALALVGESDVKFADATWYLPNVPRSAVEDYRQDHIPAAVYFDIDAVSDSGIDLPHMYPSLEVFSKCVGDLGIGDSDRVIVYDRGNFVASARAWWMFRSFGHEDVRVLDGGLNAWKQAGGSTEDSLPQVVGKPYSGNAAGNAVVLHGELMSSLHDPSMALLDARSEGRFSGAEPEPRPGLRGGHIPGSLNMYYGDVLDSNGFMKSPEEVENLLSSLSVDSDQTIVTTCGSGVTAAILLLAINQTRTQPMRLYDGSWTEWALNPDSPIGGE